MTDIKDTKLMKRIKTARILLVIYGLFGLIYGPYLFVSSIIELLYHSGGGTEIFALPFVVAVPLIYIFGALKEFTAAAQLQDNVLLGVQTGVVGQLLIGIPGILFILSDGIDYLEDKIGYIGSLSVPLLWLLYNIFLYFNLHRLKKSVKKQSL